MPTFMINYLFEWRQSKYLTVSDKFRKCFIQKQIEIN